MGTSGAQKIPMRPSSPAPSPGVPFCSTQPLTAASPGVSGLRGRLPSSPAAWVWPGDREPGLPEQTISI